MTGLVLGAYLVSAYCCPPHCGLTASGVQVGPGHLAADPRMLPFGTRLQLDAFPGRTFTVTDTGGDIRGNRLDIWMASCDEAIRWGKRWVTASRPLAEVSEEAVWIELLETVRYFDTDKWVVKEVWNSNRGLSVTFTVEGE